MVNRVTLIGRVGKEPEQKTFGEKTLTKFSFATSESSKDKNGEWQEKTQWHQVSYWNNIKLEKGDMLFIEGKIEYREHEGKYYTDIIASYCRKINTGQKAQSVEVEVITQTEFDTDLPF
jgi:single-strand DNA-binding protein